MNNFEVLEGSLIKYTFPITKEEFEEALDYAFEVVKPNAKVEGFRKGKVPRDLYERKVGVSNLYPSAYEYLFKKYQAKIFSSNPEYNLRKLLDYDFINEPKRGEDNQIFLLFDYIPSFDIPKYEGIEVKGEEVRVTDEILFSYIRSKYPSLISEIKKESGVIEKNDIALFDFKGYVDDVAFEGGEATNYRLVIGSRQFIPGFEDQMVGMKKGETKDLFVKFPEEYHAENLKGKDAKFVVKINEIYTEKIDYSKMPVAEGEVVDPKSTEEKIKKEVLDQEEAKEKSRQYEEALNILVESANLKVSEALIQEQIDNIISQARKRAEQYKIPFNLYLYYSGYRSEEDYIEQVKAVGEKSVKLDLILERIIIEKNFNVDEAEVKELLKENPNASKPQAEFFLKRAKVEKHILDNIKVI